MSTARITDVDGSPPSSRSTIRLVGVSAKPGVNLHNFCFDVLEIKRANPHAQVTAEFRGTEIRVSVIAGWRGIYNEFLRAGACED